MHVQATRIKSLKKTFFNVWSGRKRVFYAFLRTSRPPESSPEKIIFSPLEWLKTCFDAFTDHQNQVLKKLFFSPLEWLKTCFDAFAHTSRPPKSFFQKRCFETSVVVENVFEAFAHTYRPAKFFFLKRCFWTSVVVKNVFWCICAYFQTARNFFSKKIFLNVWSG